jgi:hypothetical protein
VRRRIRISYVRRRVGNCHVRRCISSRNERGCMAYYANVTAGVLLWLKLMDL